MDPIIEKLNQAKPTRGLRADKKAEIRAALLARIDADEARNPAPASLWHFVLTPVRVAFAVGFFIAIVSAGTSYAAEGALPGDPLYAVKIFLNENVRSAFAFTPEAKADWESQRAGRRLDEAAALASKGKMTDEKSSEIENKFDAHVDAVEAQVEHLREQGDPETAAKLAARFENSLSAREQAVQDLAAVQSDDNLDLLAFQVQNRMEDVADARFGAELDVELTRQNQ